MNEKIKWGIIGPGRIARAFAEGLSYTSNAELYGVASRTLQRSKDFANEWSVPMAFGSYQELAEEKSIDAIYVATPHSEHHDAALTCMRNRKAVLCEKPLAVNATQAFSMVQEAKKQEVLLMEGMWSRFPPLMEKVRQLVHEKVIGEIRLLQADFGFMPKDLDPAGRLFNPSLAGGSLLDVGIYPISFSSMLLGMPIDIETIATLGKTEVDEQASYLLKYESGAHAMLHSSICCETSQEATIFGTLGSIRIHKQCWRPQKITITNHSTEKQEIIEMPFNGNGFNYEAESFSDLLLSDKKDSDIMPMQESLEIITLLDRIREKWGLRYPFEKN